MQTRKQQSPRGGGGSEGDNKLENWSVLLQLLLQALRRTKHHWHNNRVITRTAAEKTSLVCGSTNGESPQVTRERLFSSPARVEQTKSL